jgi:hypothetical protein
VKNVVRRRPLKLLRFLPCKSSKRSPSINQALKSSLSFFSLIAIPLDAIVFLRKRDTKSSAAEPVTASGANNGVLATNGESEKHDVDLEKKIESEKSSDEIGPVAESSKVQT